MNTLLHEYKNGNAEIKIYSDGTRICETEDDEFKFEVPLNMDIKITNKCDMGCLECHENSIPNGKHAELESFKFLDSWLLGCEAAIGGGMVTEHPKFIEILKLFKSKGIITNATFHQDEFVENFELIKQLQEDGLLYGIGVSLHKPNHELICCVNQLNNVVLHVIAGLTNDKQLKYIYENCWNKKILILGYKTFRRGLNLYFNQKETIDKNIEMLRINLPKLIGKFDVVSFDNLALEQLDVKSLVSEKLWNKFYQGDEGSSNMYIDAVEKKFARNSTSEIRHDLQDDVKNMFKIIKEKIINEKK